MKELVLLFLLTFAPLCPASEVYGTASDGTTLTWDIQTPVGTGPWPWILTIESAQWVKDKGVLPSISQPILDAGFAAVHVWHHLAPPGMMIGQVEAGRYPRQTDDLEMAVAWAKLDSRCDGRVGAVGASGGATLAAILQAKGLVFAAVLFSPATYLPDLAGTGPAWSKAVNYAATAADREAASPLIYLQLGVSTPALLVAFQFDQMPYNQYTDYDDALLSLGIDHESHLIPGIGHAWTGRYYVDWIGFLQAHLPPL